MSIGALRAKGFDVLTRNHADAVLSTDFPEAVAELADALSRVRIPAEELIRSGGGEARSTQRLRHALAEAGWPKHNFVIRKTVDGAEREATSHEIDHVRRTDAGTLALEIEWNNKDPFFDRDLENFQRLHAEGAISAGIIVTRGASFQREIVDVIRSCAASNGVVTEADLTVFGLEPTKRQREGVNRRMAASGKPFIDAWAELFVADKFGAATTHWAKLEQRIARGVGNPCPLLLIGLPRTVITP